MAGIEKKDDLISQHKRIAMGEKPEVVGPNADKALKEPKK